MAELIQQIYETDTAFLTDRFQHCLTNSLNNLYPIEIVTIQEISQNCRNSFAILLDLLNPIMIFISTFPIKNHI